MPVIRNAARSDTAAILKLWYDTAVRCHPFIPRSHWNGLRTDMEHVRIPASQTWVATGNTGRIIGFVSVMEDTVTDIFVERAMQSGGVGTALIRHVMARKTPLFTEVFERNTRAREFFRRCGFVETDRFIQEETGELIVRKKMMAKPGEF